MSASLPATAPRVMRLCLWCVVAVMVEVGLYLSYRGHDARFHWFTHFFVGSAATLVVMSVVALRTRRPVCVPLVWLLVGHLFAMLPDLAFTSGHVAHEPWMDVFLGHISSHFAPGRNVTWYLVFLAATACYLVVLDQLRPPR